MKAAIMVRDYWRTVLMQAEMTLRQNVMDSFIIFTVLIQPMLIALMALWMLKDKGPEYIMFVIVGSGMTGLWSSLLFISGNSVNVERWSGTLEGLVAVPTPMQVIVFGKNLANVLQSLASMVLSYLLVVVLLGYSAHLAQPLLFLISLALTAVAFISFGLIIAPIFVMNPGVQHFQNALEFPVYILCGFLFPIAMLPGWTTPVSYLLPPYWAARALQGTAQGGITTEQLLFYWGMLLLFSLIDLIIAGRLFSAMLVKARRDATLNME